MLIGLWCGFIGVLNRVNRVRVSCTPLSICLYLITVRMTLCGKLLPPFSDTWCVRTIRKTVVLIYLTILYIKY